jgi:uncharacterized membrane protein YqjE
MSIHHPAQGAQHPQGTPTRFFDLVERLIGEVGTLLDTKLALLTLELKSQAAAIVRGVAALLVGIVVALLGLLVLTLAAALWLGAAIQSMPGGFGIVGGALLVIGAVLAAVVRQRLSAQRLKPKETVQELRRDAKWISDEL